MNFAHLHLLLNHFPVLGTMMGLGLFLLSFIGKNADLRRASLIIFAAMALLAIPTFLSGYGAQSMIQNAPGVSKDLIARHEGSAMLSIWFMFLTGALAMTGIWQTHQIGRVKTWTLAAILVVSFLTVGLMARTGNTGGDIRHTEIWAGEPAPTTDTGVAAMVHAFEPSPANFAAAMVASKWVWALNMDVHFIGLALIIGIIGILDLRILGLLRQVPIGPLHRFVPWAIFGLFLNIVTGFLAYIGESENYVYSAPFWLKMLCLMLLGVNVVAFYMTDIFDRTEPLGTGEDAPGSAKLIAVCSLVLWLTMITMGRYIQVVGPTIPHVSLQ
jgi:uncharacterized membrane protein